MSIKDEKEFLKLAGIYLACRWQVMGGEVSTGVSQKKGDPIKTFHFAMLGLHDYQGEMELLIGSCKSLIEKISVCGYPPIVGGMGPDRTGHGGRVLWPMTC